MRKTLLPGIAVLLVALTSAAAAQTESRYNELVEQGEEAIKSFGLLITALGHQRETMEPRADQHHWTQHPEVELSDSQHTSARRQWRDEIDRVHETVQLYEIYTVYLIGYSQIGTVEHLDYYFTGHSARGPVLFRMSVQGPSVGDGQIHIFAIQTFAGWDEVREEMPNIRHKAGRQEVVGVTYAPQDLDDEDAPDDEDAADENETDEP